MQIIWKSSKLAVNGSFYGCVMFNPRHWSGSQIRISMRITPNFELVFATVIVSLLAKFHQNPDHVQILFRITPNIELGLPMIITSLLTKFHQNATSSLREILLTNEQTNRQTNKHTKVIAISRFSREKNVQWNWFQLLHHIEKTSVFHCFVFNKLAQVVSYI